MNFDSPITAAIINNINGIPPQNLSKEVRCEICNINVSSYIVLRDHIAGRKHKNQFKFLSRKKNRINLNCTICNYLSKDVNDWEVHVTSESHVEKVKFYTPQQTVEIPPTPFIDHMPALSIPQQPVPAVSTTSFAAESYHPTPTVSTTSSTTPQRPLPAVSTSVQSIPPLLPPNEIQELQQQKQQKLNEKALRQILSKDRKEWNCINCKVICQSICSWEAHLASKKHRKNKHKFHTYPGISKEYVKRRYQTSFVRALETVGNEFIEDGVVFYCKRCDVRMETKLQLEIHMSSNMHKLNHPIAPIPVQPVEYGPVSSNQQLFYFDNSSYGYGNRNWTGEQYIFNKNLVPASQAEILKQQEMERQRQLVEDAKNKLLARFPFYALNLQNQEFTPPLLPEDIPMPVPAPEQN